MSEEGMSCALCRLARTACDRKLPCERCVRLNLAHRCFLPPPCKRGRPSRQASSASAETPVRVLLPQQVPHDGPPAAAIAAGLPAAYPPPPPSQPQLQPQATPTPGQKGTKRLLRLGADEDRATPGGAGGPISAEDDAAGLGGRTTAFLADAIVGLKEDMRAMADQMSRVQKKLRKNAKRCQEHHHHHRRPPPPPPQEQDGQSTHDQVLRQLQRRVAQLEEDNSQLRNQLAHIAASRYGVYASPTATTTTTALAATTFTPSPDGARYEGAENGPGQEMLWCFPFLRHYDFASRRFVVDDLQKAVVVLKVHPPGPHGRGSSSAVFANHQFCHVSGFSMAELLGREMVWVVPRHDKKRFLTAWLNGSRAGLSEIVPCCHRLEYKGGNLATIMSRSQFFFSTDEKLTYVVICVDQMLGVESLPYSIEEAHRGERAEWQDVLLNDRPAQAAGQAPSLALQPPPPPPPLVPIYQQQLALHAASLSPELEAHTPATSGLSWHDFLLPDDDQDHLTTQTDFSSTLSPFTSHLFPPSS